MLYVHCREEKLVERAKSLKVNVGTDPDADLGPVISKQVHEFFQSQWFQLPKKRQRIIFDPVLQISLNMLLFCKCINYWILVIFNTLSTFFSFNRQKNGYTDWFRVALKVAPN